MSAISAQQQSIYSYLNIQIEDSVKAIKEKRALKEGVDFAERQEWQKETNWTKFSYGINKLSPQVIADIHHLKENDIIFPKNGINIENIDKIQNVGQISSSDTLYLSEYVSNLYKFAAQMNKEPQTTIEFMYKNNQSFDYKV